MARKQQFLERPKHPNSLREACKLIDGLWALVQDLRAVNERLGANSTNSSTPPSQDRLSGTAEKERHRKPSSKKRGAQPGHVRNAGRSSRSPRSIRSNVTFRIPVAPAAAKSLSIRTPRIAIRFSIFPKSPIPSPNTNASAGPALAAITPLSPNSRNKPPLVRWVRALSPGLHSSADTSA